MGKKEHASREALKFIKKNQIIGLGTGSTAAIFIKLLAEKEKAENLNLKCIPTSNSSKALAYAFGLALLEPSEAGHMDVAIDGADAIDSKFNLIKGGGGAHVREKVIDYFADKFIVVAAAEKYSKKLKGPVPLEVLRFAFPIVKLILKEKFKVKVELRRKANGDAVMSDNGNYIADAFFKSIPSPAKLEGQLDEVPGIVGNGIFSKNVDMVILGYEKKVKVLKKRK